MLLVGSRSAPAEDAPADNRSSARAGKGSDAAGGLAAAPSTLPPLLHAARLIIARLTISATQIRRVSRVALIAI